MSKTTEYEVTHHVYVESLDEEFAINYYFQHSEGYPQTRDTPADPGDMELVQVTADSLPVFPLKDLRHLLDFANDVENYKDQAETEAYEQADDNADRYEGD